MNPREPIVAIEFKGSSFVFISQSVKGAKTLALKTSLSAHDIFRPL